MVTSEGPIKGQRPLRVQGCEITFSVVQDSLDQDWVLGESLCNQQDALLDAVTTQQRTPTGPLSIMGRRKPRSRLKLV